jgi:hypothetical protein
MCSKASGIENSRTFKSGLPAGKMSVAVSTDGGVREFLEPQAAPGPRGSVTSPHGVELLLRDARSIGVRAP